MLRHPIFSICVAFIFGIVFYENFPQNPPFIYVGLGFSFVLAVANLWFSQKIFRDFSFVFLFFSLGNFCHFLNENKSPNVELGKEEEIVFQLDKKLNSNEKNRRYEITIFNQKEKIRAVASVPKDIPPLDYLHHYQSVAWVSRIEKPQYSYQFDYQKYTQRHDIFYQLYFPNEIEKMQTPKLSFSDKIKQYRLDILTKIDNSDKISPKNREFLKGIILADRTDMDTQTLESFSKTGLMHILAISGAHIAIIFGVALFLFSKILLKRWAVFISLVFIWVFAGFIGLGNSVFRSAIMLTIYYLYIVFQRNPNALHTLGLSAFLILIFNTNEIYDIGFQLSFSAVAGIFLLNKPISNIFPKFRNKILKYISNTITITLSAQLATLPLVLYYFHNFPLISLISNVIAIPCAELVIILSFFLTIFLDFGFHSDFVEVAYDKVVKIFFCIIEFFSKIEGVFIQHIPMSVLEVIVLIIIILSFRKLLLQYNLKNLIRFGFLILIFLMTRTFLDMKSHQKNEILVYNDYKGGVLSIKNKNKIQFFLPENADEKRLKKYLIFPYLNHCRTSDFSIKFYPENTQYIVYKGVSYPVFQK